MTTWIKRLLKNKKDLRKPLFKNGEILTAKQLNYLYKEIEKLKRQVKRSK